MCWNLPSSWFDPLGCKLCFYSWSPSLRFVTCFIFISANKERVDQSHHLLHPHILPSSISLHLCLLWDCLVTAATASSRHERKGEWKRRRRKMAPASSQCVSGGLKVPHITYLISTRVHYKTSTAYCVSAGVNKILFQVHFVTFNHLELVWRLKHGRF